MSNNVERTFALYYVVYNIDGTTNVMNINECLTITSIERIN